MAFLTQEQTIDLKARTLQGRENLTLGNIREALKIFLNILKDYPDDVHTYLTLGDLYLASNQEATAMRLYSDALRIEPQNQEIIRRIKLAALEIHEGAPAVIEKIPTDPSAISRLLQRLTDRPAPVAEEEIDQAAALLEAIVRSSSPAQTVQDHLDEIDALLPALLEINIRQAQADGQPDLANALGKLQENIRLQLYAHRSARESAEKGRYAGESSRIPDHFQGKVLLLTSDEIRTGSRLDILRDELVDNGCTVRFDASMPDFNTFKPDVVIASNAHKSPDLMHSLAAFSALQIPILLDLDCDFDELPINHPSYAAAGLGNPQVARAYLTSLTLSDRIVVSSSALADTLQAAYEKTVYIPDSWSKKSEMWSKKPHDRSTINIGWIGSVGQVEDLILLRRVVVRVLRQHPQTQLVIAGDIKAFQMFETVPENRKIFLPSIESEDLPYLLGEIDILMVPLRNTAFNRSTSDSILVNAGVKGIPWIASPIHAFQEWKEGGILANSLDEWHVYLSQLISDPVLRTSLGEAGWRKAQERESTKMWAEWLSLIEQVVKKEFAATTR